MCSLGTWRPLPYAICQSRSYHTTISPKPREIPSQCQLRHTHVNNANGSVIWYTIGVECITHSVDEALLSEVVHSHGDVNHIFDKLLHWTFVFLENSDQHKRYDHKQFAVSSIACILTSALSRKKWSKAYQRFWPHPQPHIKENPALKGYIPS